VKVLFLFFISSSHTFDDVIKNQVMVENL